MPTTHSKRKGPIGHGMETVAQAGAYLDRQLGGMVGMNPAENYPERPYGETEAGFMNRMAGRTAATMSLADWLRFTAYEYMAGGVRRERLVASGLGTEDQRKAYWKGQQKNPAKFERCVRDVEARGEDVNAYAVCTAAGTRNPSVMEFAKKDAAYAYARLMEAEGWVAKVVRRGFKWGVELVKGARNPGKGILSKQYDSYREGYDKGLTSTAYGDGRIDDVAEFKSKVAGYSKDWNEKLRAFGIGFDDGVAELRRRDFAVKRKRKGNPETQAAEMYESFHGQPSEEVTEFVEDHHYHENLAELGVLAGVVVETEYAGVMALAFSGYKWDDREGAFELKAGRENPLFGGLSGLFGKRTTTYHAKSGGTTTTTGRLNYKGKQILHAGDGYEVPSIDPESRFDTVKDAKKFIDEWSKNPKSVDGYPVVKKEMDAWALYDADAHEIIAYAPGAPWPISKTKALREKGSGHKVYYIGIPDKQNPDPTNSDTTLLASNEKGTQLFLVGGDQSVDIDSFKFKGAEGEHESIVLGNVQQITYHTSKVFYGKLEQFDYFHHFSEDTKGPLPTLRYDAVNEKLYLDGGCYKINKPFMGTSPGIED